MATGDICDEEDKEKFVAGKTIRCLLIRKLGLSDCVHWRRAPSKKRFVWSGRPTGRERRMEVGEKRGEGRGRDGLGQDDGRENRWKNLANLHSNKCDTCPAGHIASSHRHRWSSHPLSSANGQRGRCQARNELSPKLQCMLYFKSYKIFYSRTL